MTCLTHLRVSISAAADLDQMRALLLNVFQASEIGCHIITVTAGICRRAERIGRDLTDLLQDTVRMFRDDAAKARFVP